MFVLSYFVINDSKLKPPSGVYATSVQIDDEVFKSMTNIGKRPSVDVFDYVTIEAFILESATPKFAVGIPTVLPRALPCSTSPIMMYGCPQRS